MHHDSGRLAVDRAEYEAQLREKQHQDDVMRRLADPSTPEGVVAQKAYRRIAELLEELKLDEGHLELATQVDYSQAPPSTPPPPSLCSSAFCSQDSLMAVAFPPPPLSVCILPPASIHSHLYSSPRPLPPPPPLPTGHFG